jgi:hypothetical protein
LLESLRVSTQRLLHSVRPEPEQTHEPEEQAWSARQRFPQRPQFAGSVDGSTHAPLHSVRPVPQLETHVPLSQTWPAAHARPHPPQLAGSLRVSMHRPVHSARPPVQLQRPAAQAWSRRHAAPQTPQCSGFVCRSTQAAEQLVRPPVQVEAQVDSVQTSSVMQRRPQAPQLNGSVERSTQAELQIDHPGRHPPESASPASASGRAPSDQSVSPVAHDPSSETAPRANRPNSADVDAEECRMALLFLLYGSSGAGVEQGPARSARRRLDRSSCGSSTSTARAGRPGHPAKLPTCRLMYNHTRPCDGPMGEDHAMVASRMKWIPVFLGLAVGGCRRSQTETATAADTQASVSDDAVATPHEPDLGSPADVPGSVTAEDAVAEVGSGDVPAPVEPAECDVSTPERAENVFVRLTGREADRRRICAVPVRAIDGALIGMVDDTGDCVRTHVLHDCRALEYDSAPAVVLGALGWSSAGPAERERLATLWVNDVAYAHLSLPPEVVLHVARPALQRLGCTFEPPAAEVEPDGGVRIVLWGFTEGGASDSRAVRREFVFAPDGSMISQELESFDPHAGQTGESPITGRMRWLRAERSGGEGRLDDGVFEAALRHRKYAVQLCYLDGRGKDPDAGGDLVFLVTVGERAEVTVELETDSASLAAAGVTSCLTDRLGTLELAESPPQGGAARFRVSVSFAPP